jgi:SAM-dependent methyltransferase
LLTVDFSRFRVGPGDRVLDIGCGGGRHAFELLRRGADVVALDRSGDDLAKVGEMFRAMAAAGEAPAGARASAVRGDALALPFPGGSFDAVIAAEVFEHITDDTRAMAEVVRVLRPRGRVAVTVPRWLPERVCWALSRAYHEVEGGHVRIYRSHELAGRLRTVGLQPIGSHYAHALHAPYWWLNCVFGERSAIARAYHRMLVWDIVKRPRVTRATEQALNPLIGKSLVIYARKPPREGSAVAAA